MKLKCQRVIARTEFLVQVEGEFLSVLPPELLFPNLAVIRFQHDLAFAGIEIEITFYFEVEFEMIAPVVCGGVMVSDRGGPIKVESFTSCVSIGSVEIDPTDGRLRRT